MTDHGEPFVLVAVDDALKFRNPLYLGRAIPDSRGKEFRELPSPLLADSMKINRTKMYRKAALNYEHGVILSYYDANNEFLDELPLFDVIYLDYGTKTQAGTENELAHWAKHVRDGGLLILEKSFNGDLSKFDDLRDITDEIEIELISKEEVEFTEFNQDKISIFKVNSKVNKQKLPKLEFLANCFHERRQNTSTLRDYLENGRIPWEHPKRDLINDKLSAFFEIDPSPGPDEDLFYGPRIDMKGWRFLRKERTGKI